MRAIVYLSRSVQAQPTEQRIAQSLDDEARAKGRLRLALYLGLQSRVANSLGVQRGRVSTARRGTRKSERISAALDQEIARVEVQIARKFGAGRVAPIEESIAPPRPSLLSTLPFEASGPYHEALAAVDRIGFAPESPQKQAAVEMVVAYINCFLIGPFKEGFPCEYLHGLGFLAKADKQAAASGISSLEMAALRKCATEVLDAAPEVARDWATEIIARISVAVHREAA